MTTQQHTIIAAVLAIIGAYLIRLTAVEIQPSPEGYIAEGGRAMMVQGPMADVAPYSSGGLTTGCIPPLVPATISVLLQSLGDSPIAVRLLSIICVGISLLLIYGIARQVLPHKGALQALLITGFSLPWYIYGRQANTDIVGVCFVLAGIVLLERLAADRTMIERSWIVLGFVGLCALAGSASIAAAALLAVCALLYFAVTGSFIYVACAIIGLAAASPYIVYMFSVYGNQVLLASSINVLPSEPSTLHTGPLDVVAYAVLGSPAIVVSLIWVLSSVMRRRSLTLQLPRLIRIVALIFLPLLILGALRGIRAYEAMIFIVPFGAILSVYAMEQFRQREHPQLLLIGLAATFVASVSSMLVFSFLAGGTIKLFGVMIVTAYGLYMLVTVTRGRRYKNPRLLAVHTYQPVLNASIATVGVLAVISMLFGSPYTIEGARQIAYELKEHALLDPTYTYVYHKHSPTSGVNPQLEWYMRRMETEGMMSHEAQRIEMGDEVIRKESLDLIMGVKSIVYYHPENDRRHVTDVHELLAPLYDQQVVTKDYTLFTLKR